VPPLTVATDATDDDQVADADTSWLDPSLKVAYAAQGRLVPRAMLRVGGSIDSDLALAAVTWSWAKDKMPWSVAVTTAFPAWIPVATPPAMEATFLSDVDQVTSVETSLTLPSANDAVAVNGC
jgi:hypothetical protein